MIRELKSDLESFKTLTFGPGLNVILADKSPDATDLQSRNGAGKTSFVELVHLTLRRGCEATKHLSVGCAERIDLQCLGRFEPTNLFDFP